MSSFLYIAVCQSILDNNMLNFKYMAASDKQAIERVKTNDIYFYRKTKEVKKVFNENNLIVIFTNPDFKLEVNDRQKSKRKTTKNRKISK